MRCYYSDSDVPVGTSVGDGVVVAVDGTLVAVEVDVGEEVLLPTTMIT